MTQQVAETVTFTLNPGVSTEEFVQLSKASEAFVRANPGFIFRRLSCGSDGSWTDTVIWKDMETALEVAETFAQQEFAPALMAVMAPDSVSIRHETIHWTMAPS
ncbi:hypothetical protein [Phaeobacter sp. 11ANDIMAR09]|uniref:hypothetical protein n=1 Tax=Phaeobacter sp. 11ANDIMAR09 TaxID=1225647 RepID=UPI0006C8D07A|nr:hypothetical protein [Phaeobacter sp. 11ANDIMAR09]KPD12623.1 hypothetical protein AN476_09950 [Phaeobacter sp. 11ANDIMAR09]OIQ34575.1 MAG: hypothetical protein BM559_06110 [Roseobacter sp. MedPE-SWchi]